MQKSKKIWIIPVSLFILVSLYGFFCIGLVVKTFLGLDVSEEYVMKIFNKNKYYFEETIVELSDNNNISLTRKNDSIWLDIEGKQEVFIFPKDQQTDKYKSSIYILEKLKIEKITKYDNNILFTFNSGLSKSQLIAYITNRGKFDFDYPHSKMNHIADRWYYVELD